jgi:hypothetical protein
MRTPILAFISCFASFATADEYVTIKGQVKWNGEAAPKLVPFAVGQLRALPAGAVAPMPTDVLVDAKSLGLKNVVVWLRPDTEDRKDVFPPEKIKKELRNADPTLHSIDVSTFQFEPRVVAARTGDTLEFRNPSSFPFSPNYVSDAETLFLLLPANVGRAGLKAPLLSQRTPITFNDNLYPWMSGRVRVFDHPYFAITDKDGRFEIKGAPVGKWRLVYWHENGFHQGRAGILGFPLDVKPNKPGSTTMELKPMAFEMPGK